jgi:predicted adenine nucleotide alpha hydrolase (AANH) superfamily ATPase
MKISITSPQEQFALKIAEEMQITSVQEFKFMFAIVSKVMAMYEDDNSEELLEQIQDLTETEDGDVRCSTCDHVNDLIKNR